MYNLPETYQHPEKRKRCTKSYREGWQALEQWVLFELYKQLLTPEEQQKLEKIEEEFPGAAKKLVYNSVGSTRPTVWIAEERSMKGDKRQYKLYCRSLENKA